MRIAPSRLPDRQFIQGYGGGGFRVSEVRYLGAILVLPQRTLAWPVGGFGAIDAASLEPVLCCEPRPELLLLGCGPSLRAVPAALRQALKAAGLGVEAMDTGAACRTYNVLLLEERRVAAALLPVD